MPRPIDISNIPPELLSLLDSAAQGGEAEDQQALLADYLRKNYKDQNTEMPQGMMVRDQYIAPSPFGVASATIKQIQGGQEAMRTQAQQQRNIGTMGEGWKSGMLAELLREYAGTGAAPTPGAGFQAPQQGFSALDNPLAPTGPGPAAAMDPMTGVDLKHPETLAPRPKKPQPTGYRGPPLYYGHVPQE